MFHHAVVATTVLRSTSDNVQLYMRRAIEWMRVQLAARRGTILLWPCLRHESIGMEHRSWLVSENRRGIPLEQVMIVREFVWTFLPYKKRVVILRTIPYCLILFRFLSTWARIASAAYLDRDVTGDHHSCYTGGWMRVMNRPHKYQGRSLQNRMRSGEWTSEYGPKSRKRSSAWSSPSTVLLAESRPPLHMGLVARYWRDFSIRQTTELRWMQLNFYINKREQKTRTIFSSMIRQPLLSFLSGSSLNEEKRIFESMRDEKFTRLS